MYRSLGSWLATALLFAAQGAPDSNEPNVEPGVEWSALDEERFAVERRSMEAQERLKLLASALKKGERAKLLFANEFASNSLRPELSELRNSNGTRVRQATKDSFAEPMKVREPWEQLESFMAPLRGAEEPHVHFKIIESAIRSNGGLQITVLLETGAKSGVGAVQQDATWSLAFDGQDPPLIQSIEARELTEVAVQRLFYRDVTAQVLGEAGGSGAILSAGSERWHGAIDNLGEPNQFGHNGIAVGDVNGDDLDDLYVAQGTGLPNLLFVQGAKGDFREVGESAGVAWLDDTKGVLLLDFDNDGDRDLAACIGPLIVLCTNDGEARFEPARSLSTDSEASFYSLSAADFDSDGDLDLYGVRYVQVAYGQSLPVPFHDARNGPPNHLFRNDGKQGFFDVTTEVGLDANNDRFSLASSWSDYDQDGDPDLYVANDFGRNNFYRNDGGRFVDVAAQLGCEDQAAGMGVSWEDVDLDGRVDLFVSNMFSSAGRRIAFQPEFKSGEGAALRGAVQRHALGNSLFCQSEGGGFEDVSELAGVRMGRWSWGARFTDFDMDGLPDVCVPNGFLTGDTKDDL